MHQAAPATLDPRLHPSSRVRQSWWVALLVLLAVQIYMRVVPADPSNLGVNAATFAIIAKFSVLALALAVTISLLGWWRSVLFDTTRASLWWQSVLLIPGVALIVALGTVVGAHDIAFILTGVALIVTSAIAEELLYRGVVVVGLRASRVPEWLVWIISAVIFALIHFGNLLAGVPMEEVVPQVVNAFFLGSFLYGARLLTGTLWVPFVLHVLNNLPIYFATEENVSDPVLNGAITVAQVFILGSPLVLAVYFIVRAVRRSRR